MPSQFNPPLDISEARACFPEINILYPLDPGGEGAVFKGVDQSSRTVLLKVYGPNRQHRRTELEVTKLKAVSSPYLAKLHDDGKKVIRGLDCYYIVMDFIEGTNLRDLLKTGTHLDQAGVKELLKCTSQAIDALWAVSVVHCDIKPENIIRTTSGSFVLIDLGLAKHLDAETITVLGAIYGTPGYLAPEQFQGRKNLTLRADYFALGVVAYEMLTGSHPFNFRQELIMHQPMPHLPSNITVEQRIKDVINLLAHPLPYRRPKDAQEISGLLGGTF
jgi:serine/threonine-protein kinase